ncbi:MAG: ribose-5-phosphate isomerase RpiA [Methanomicrobiales archaeon]|jgi:ribose 5-phosphate isomerase A|nr:ribose-5-phosphate isomerase RpiA [Methanomicrobiales archaeon]
MSEAKRAAGYRAADMVQDAMVIGIGTGSTVYYMMERLAQRISEGLCVRGIPTSFQTEIRARELGIPLCSLADVSEIDIAIDGADQVDPHKWLIKGRGAAHVRERVIAASAKIFLVIIDSSKCVLKLDGPIPMEVTPFAVSYVTTELAKQGTILIREGVKKDGPVISDNGNFILDYSVGVISDPRALQQYLNNVAGVVGCGLMTEFSDKIVIIEGGYDNKKG